MANPTNAASLERGLGRVEGKLDSITDKLVLIDERFVKLEMLTATVATHTRYFAFIKRSGATVIAIGTAFLTISAEWIMKLGYAVLPQ